MKKYLTRSNILYASFLCAVIVSCLICSVFFYQLAVIDGESMSPTYSALSLVIIDKTADEYSAGDVIAVSVPSVGGSVVKRIAALPGDRIIISEGKVIVNGEESPYFGYVEYAGLAECELTLPEGGYFLIGDNTNESRDSRYEEIGIVYESDIIGKIIPQR